ncbi:hypothetical protein [Rheinheimera texasensis]|uniref:hypothetical protein n=1 Tax=Rheinheimera texasensis TaxID=306205 RepID=UPI0004E0B4BA|nr:hypothetical protein [Rheinheimera texasensis]
MKAIYLVLTILVCLLQEALIVQLYCLVTGQNLPPYLLSPLDKTDLQPLLSHLLSGVLPLLGVFVVLLIVRRQSAQIRQSAGWGSLIAAAVSFSFLVLNQWVPLIEGAKMSSTFAIGSVFTLIYTCLFALLGGFLGARFGRMKAAS